MSVKTSIIIISYNEKKYLQECLDSCIAQDKNNDIEIIIGDDGSTDGSIEIIKLFQQNYPKTVNYFINDRNDGISIPSIRVSNTIKKALNISKGDYCVIISGDDIFLDKDFITKAKIIFDNDNKKKYSSVVSTKFNYFWDNGKTELKQCKCNSNKIYWALFYKHLSCFVFRKEFVVGKLLNRFCDDTGLEYILATSGKWKYIDTIAFGYRQRDFSIMHSTDILKLNLLELLLFQDCLNYKKLLFSSLSRFYRPLKYIRNNMLNIDYVKHKDFIESFDQYANNVIDMINKKKLYINILIILGCFSKYIFRLTSFFSNPHLLIDKIKNLITLSKKKHS